MIGSSSILPPGRLERLRSQLRCCSIGTLGTWLIIISTVMLSLSKFFVKVAASSVNPLLITSFRFSLQILLSLPFALKNRASLGGMDWKEYAKFIGAAACKAGAQAATFYGVSLILVGEAVVLLNLQPIMVCFIAWLFLGEKIGLLDVLLSIITIAGVVITCNPHFNNLNMERVCGILVMVAAAALNSIGNCLTRFLGSRHFSTLILAQGLIGLPLVSAIYLSTSEFSLPDNVTTSLTIFALCVLAIGGRCLETKAFQIADATPLTILKTFEIAICFLLQYFFLNVQFTVMSAGGTALVSLCVVSICVKDKFLQCFQKIRPTGDRSKPEEPLIQEVVVQSPNYETINS